MRDVKIFFGGIGLIFFGCILYQIWPLLAILGLALFYAAWLLIIIGCASLLVWFGRFLMPLVHSVVEVQIKQSEIGRQRATIDLHRKALDYAISQNAHVEMPGMKIMHQAIAASTRVTEQKPPALPPPTEVTVQMPTGRELLLNGMVEQALAEGFIILGMGEDGKLKRLKIKRCFSTLISGLPSVGKTTTVFWVTGQLTLIGAKLWIVDPHMHFQDEDGNRSLAAELSELSDSFVFPPCDGDTEEVIDRVRYMYQQLCIRQKPGYIVRAKDTIIGIMDEFNSVADSIDPSLVVTNHKGRNINFAQTLALLEREGRKFGLHFMLIGHKWAKQDIGGDNAVRTNATTYLCHRLNDQHQADLLLGTGEGKKVLKLQIGTYWITGPTWNAEPAKIVTPLISAIDLPILLQIKRRGVSVINEANVVEGNIVPEQPQGTQYGHNPGDSTGHNSGYISGHTTTPAMTGPLNQNAINPLGKQLDITTEPEVLLPSLQPKLLMVMEMDEQHKSQNEIINQVWGVDPASRAGRAAVEELRQIRAYMAKQTKKSMRREV